MATVREVLDRARAPLNDASSRRYTEQMLTGYLLEGLRYLRRQRPDLFLANLADPFTVDETDTAKLVIEDGYTMSLADYVTARCQLHDTEAKAIEKAQSFLALSTKALS